MSSRETVAQRHGVADLAAGLIGESEAELEADAERRAALRASGAEFYLALFSHGQADKRAMARRLTDGGEE